jgi:hypothetical protein
MLKLGLVDCENWDVFAVLEDRVGKPKEAKSDPRPAAEREQTRASMRATALAQFERHLREGHAVDALELDEKMTCLDDAWQLSQAQRLELVKSLHHHKLWSQSVAPMVEYLRHAADGAPRVRLRLAQILLVHEHRPGRALSVLEKIPPGKLNAELEKTRRQLEAQARKSYDQGEIEVDDEDW